MREAKIMYTLKVAYGYVDKPETETTGMLGTYETWDEAVEAAEDKFSSILGDLRGDDIYYGETDGKQYDYWDEDEEGDHIVEVGHVFSGLDYYCHVSVIER